MSELRGLTDGTSVSRSPLRHVPKSIAFRSAGSIDIMMIQGGVSGMSTRDPRNEDGDYTRFYIIPTIVLYRTMKRKSERDENVREHIDPAIVSLSFVSDQSTLPIYLTRNEM